MLNLYEESTLKSFTIIIVSSHSGYVLFKMYFYFMKIYTVSTKLIENPRINLLQSRGQTFLLQDTKKRSSPVFSTSLSMESLPLRDLEETKLIVSTVAKVSQPCVILIGLMPTSYSATHPLAHPPVPGDAFSALFLQLRHRRVEDSPSGSFLQDVCAGSCEGSLRQWRYKPTAVNCIAW